VSKYIVGSIGLTPDFSAQPIEFESGSETMKVSASALTNLSIRIGLAAAILVVAGAAFAQPPLDGGYQVGETPQTADAPKTDAPSTPTTPGVRLAKFDYISGDVTWRPDSNANWKPAKSNTAINSGAQIWAVGSGRAEIRFEDGSVVRLGHGAIATLDTMYSDAQGAFTRIVVSSGLGWLSLKSAKSVYEADLPAATVIASGPARVRIGAESRSDVAVRSGKAVVQTKQANAKKVTINAGNFAAVAPEDTAITIKSIPSPDSWDRWNDERDHVGPPGYAHSVYGGGVFVPVIIGGGYGPGWHRHW
jgi:hypothetical protein